ncbi:MAG: hypothetical protein M0Q95_19765 [Porticoccaceae bacterium]|jgi:hypothetical protein|nr:hypothetical protein [Porticoccaceae bacterium]
MRIVFPDVFYHKTGGAENLIYEIVKYAHLSRGVKSIILGDPKSFAVKRLKEGNIPYSFFSRENIREFIPSGTELFIHTHNYDGLSNIVDMPGSCLVWGILAPQITRWNRFGFERRITGKNSVANWFTKRLIDTLSEKSALISMDGNTSDAIDDFCGKALNLPIIPIPVDTSSALPIKRFSVDSPLVLSYIGRSDDIWKIKPVKRVMLDLQAYKHRQFKIDIYTDSEAPYLNELNGLTAENITLDFHIGYYGDTLRERIGEHSNLHFSMGTAALEGGLAGVPTLLVDPSVGDVPEYYRYKWLYQTERCSLGRFISEAETAFVGMEMKDVIAMVDDQEQYHNLAQKTQEYVMDNHGVGAVLNRLLAQETTATHNDIRRYTPATWKIAKGIGKLLR